MTFQCKCLCMLIFEMPIARGQQNSFSTCERMLLYLIEYAHNVLISNLGHFFIPETIFNARAFEFDTNIVANTTFDVSSRFCYIHRFVNLPPHNIVLAWNEMDLIFLDNMVNHPAAGVFSVHKNTSALFL